MAADGPRRPQGGPPIGQLRLFVFGVCVLFLLSFFDVLCVWCLVFVFVICFIFHFRFSCSLSFLVFRVYVSCSLFVLSFFSFLSGSRFSFSSQFLFWLFVSAFRFRLLFPFLGFVCCLRFSVSVLTFVVMFLFRLRCWIPFLLTCFVSAFVPSR